MTQVLLTRHSPAYLRVTFDHPPLNVFGPETIPQLNEVIALVEQDQDLKVVVFDSAVDGFFLTHYDLLAKLEETTGLPPGPTGLQQLPDMLVRLSRAPVVSIASVRGRATGVGSELALASDMRFASRERAVFSQWEVGAGWPGGPDGTPAAPDRPRPSPRSPARGRRRRRGTRGAVRGYVNRSLPDADLDDFVDALARRISSSTRHIAGIRASSTSTACRPTPRSPRSGTPSSPRSVGPPHKSASRPSSSADCSNRATSRPGSDTTSAC